MKTNKENKDYKIQIDTLTNEEIIATFTDVETNETYNLNTNEVQAAFTFLAPLVLVIGENLLAHLIAAGLALTIASVIFVPYAEVSDKNRNDKYDHYAAYLDTSKGVFIGNPISLEVATERLRGTNVKENNVWSKTSALAKKVALEAGGGRTPVIDTAHGSYPKFLPHYHTWNRSGGHSFYYY